MLKRHYAEYMEVVDTVSIPLDYLDIGVHPTQITWRLNDLTKRVTLDFAMYWAKLPIERITYERHWPKDWWQALKERWAPRWFNRYFPVKYNIFILDECKYAVCPHTNIEPQGTHLEWLAKQQDGYRVTDLTALENECDYIENMERLHGCEDVS